MKFPYRKRWRSFLYDGKCECHVLSIGEGYGGTSPKATMCPHSRMRTPIYGEIFSISDTDRDVTQVNYTLEEIVIDALATFFSDPNVSSIETQYGMLAFRMYTSERTGRRAPILVLTEDDQRVYLTGDHNILQELSESLVDNLDDLLEKPRDTVGGSRRRKRTRRTRRKQRKTLRKK